MENIKWFCKVDEDFVKENGLEDSKVGDILGLEVVEIDKGLTLKLKRIKESEKDAEKVSFDDIFESRWDKSLRTKRPIKIGDIPFGENVTISKGVLFAGIDFQLFKGRDLSVIKEERYWKILGIYSNN